MNGEERQARPPGKGVCLAQGSSTESPFRLLRGGGTRRRAEGEAVWQAREGSSGWRSGMGSSFLQTESSLHPLPGTGTQPSMFWRQSVLMKAIRCQMFLAPSKEQAHTGEQARRSPGGGESPGPGTGVRVGSRPGGALPAGAARRPGALGGSAQSKRVRGLGAS